MVEDSLQVGSFITFTIGILVLFIGKRVNEKVRFLREFSIPEPVSGGLFFSLLTGIVYYFFDISITFELQARDLLLVYFFTTIGINASLADLLKGGKPLIILLTATIGFMVLQDITGVTVARLLGEPGPVGLIGGTVSLIGGHGTAIAWAPKISEGYGIANAMEIGLACATFGLILASLMGGPIAKFLIHRHNLKPVHAEPLDVGTAQSGTQPTITSFQFLDSILAIHVCIVLGLFLNELLQQTGLELPLFVTCLFAGILITNLVPTSFPRLTGMPWPTRTPTMALIADISLGTFLAMSLMSMQLWTLVEMAGPIVAILSAQLILALVINLFVIFPLMGRNYDAAVVCAGFGGIALGSTPTAMANMSAVTTRYGASHLAFIIVPLVCAFFIDLVNAMLIPSFLKLF
ncbi:sodium/glutamate symporter [Ketobacter sp.]|uniref:sodium/glutamate symporter n=1 Tax=Ketobacter sp. TaxID=2083498 RepID=UPI000F1D4CBC|nr:sodium/glutamate symporter [Ketobacter sp.]RLT97451.1 MAG: sodium/glutamate symporter [Ketobacter sp.]